MKNISNTFHGRDIFTSVAAHITNGIPFEEIGNKIDDFVDLNFRQGGITEKTAIGKVVYIDRFGNIITNISGFKLLEILQFDKKVMFFIGNKSKEMPFVKSYGFVKKGQILATIGSSNLLEIGVNQGNAAKKLGATVGDQVTIRIRTP